MNGQEQQAQQEGNEMSNIEIKKVENGWEASDGAMSPDGFRWCNKHGDELGGNKGRPYRRLWVNTTTEPQRANVGDWVKVRSDRPLSSLCVKDKAYEVLERDKNCVKLLPSAGWVRDTDYTIVPDPTPEPEVFTGDPSTWGKGWYREVDGHIMVFVDCFNEWASVSDFEAVRGSQSGGYAYSSEFKFHRISDNPADGVKWEGGEG